MVFLKQRQRLADRPVGSHRVFRGCGMRQANLDRNDSQYKPPHSGLRSTKQNLVARPW
jgi:hypothetical protein